MPSWSYGAGRELGSCLQQLSSLPPSCHPSNIFPEITVATPESPEELVRQQLPPPSLLSCPQCLLMLEGSEPGNVHFQQVSGMQVLLARDQHLRTIAGVVPGPGPALRQAAAENSSGLQGYRQTITGVRGVGGDYASRLGLWEGNGVPLAEGKQDPTSSGTKLRLAALFPPILINSHCRAPGKNGQRSCE